MQYAYDLGGAADPLYKTLKVGATVVASTLVMHDTNFYGHVIPVTTTSSTDGLGLCDAAATYATSLEATTGVIINPLAVYRAKCAGSATAGTALSAATLHVLTQTTASTTVITDTTSGYSNSRDGGTVFVLSGKNKGLSRVSTSHVDATSSTVTVAFPNSVAIGDKVVVVPYSCSSHKVQPTTNLVEADASIAIGTGIDCAVVDVKLQSPINATNPEIFVYFILHDTIFDPID